MRRVQAGHSSHHLVESGGAYPNPHTGKKPGSGFMGYGGQTEQAYSGTGRGGIDVDPEVGNVNAPSLNLAAASLRSGVGVMERGFILATAGRKAASRSEDACPTRSGTSLGGYESARLRRSGGGCPIDGGRVTMHVSEMNDTARIGVPCPMRRGISVGREISPKRDLIRGSGPNPSLAG